MNDAWTQENVFWIHKVKLDDSILFMDYNGKKILD